MFDISCLERISRRWTSRPLASSSKQGIFITNFNLNCNGNFFHLFYLLINKINWYLLTSVINATCKSSNSQLFGLYLFSIFIFENSNIRIRQHRSLESQLRRRETTVLGKKFLQNRIKRKYFSARQYKNFRKFLN